MTGRPPKSTSLKLLEGNPGKRALPKDEPKPAPLENDAPPDWMADDAVAVKEWQRILPIVQRMRVMTEADFGALAEMCATFSCLREASEQVKNEGNTITGAMGGQVKNPTVTIRDDQRKILLAYQREFGLVPGSRARVKVSSPAKPDEGTAWDRLKRERQA